MKLHGIEIAYTNKPALDPDFLPIKRFNDSFLEGASQPLGLALERPDGQVAVVHTFVHGAPSWQDADNYYVDRLLKTLLWVKGGHRIHVRGSRDVFEYIRHTYAPEGARSFDHDFMADIFERPFEVVYTETLPEEKSRPQRVGGHLNGCRIGFDAGGSDRKVSAVIDGRTVYDEEVVWFPKEHADPRYHYDGIVDALKTAASHLPRVDAVGISSAGIFLGNRTMRASLFLKVPPDLTEKYIKDIYIRAVRDCFGKVPFLVANDGDVSALAGMLCLGEPNVLGIAMGTSEAGGFVDGNGCITGWLNELAFVPVDVSPEAMRDEWSGDIGCGVKYFSQDAVIKLAPRAGIALGERLSPAEKLKVVQERMAAGDEAACEVFSSIGVYLGHALAYYSDIYAMRHVLLLGRVMSGKGGDCILKEAKRVLHEEYPEISERIIPALPDERFRRVGQSAAAASLPIVENAD